MISRPKKIEMVLILVLALSLLGGCGYKDIEKRFFVVSMGVDQAKNSPKKFLVSMKLTVPAVDKKPNEFIIVSEEADSIAEAVRIIKTKVDKEIDFSHAKVLIFGDDIVKKDWYPHLYYWPTRRRDFQEISWIAIGKPSALDVLKIKSKSEQVPSNGLFLIFSKAGSVTPYTIPEYLFDFKKRFSEKGLDPYCPIVEVKNNSMQVNRVGLFNKKQFKLALSPEETKYLNFFLNKEEKSAIKINLGEKYFLIDTDKAKTSYKIYTTNRNHPYIEMKVKISGKMEEALFPVKNRDLSKYEKTAVNELNKNFKSLLLKLQKNNIDPIGFGLRYRARHFNQDDWQEWQKIYPSITFNLHTKVEIEDTGLIE